MADVNPKWGRPIYTHGPIMHRFWIGYAILTVAIVVGLFFAYRANEQVKREAVLRCHSERLDRTAIRQSLLTSRYRITHIAYYRQHPRERAQALADTDAALRRFQPIRCPS